MSEPPTTRWRVLAWVLTARYSRLTPTTSTGLKRATPAPSGGTASWNVVTTKGDLIVGHRRQHRHPSWRGKQRPGAGRRLHADGWRQVGKLRNHPRIPARRQGRLDCCYGQRHLARVAVGTNGQVLSANSGRNRRRCPGLTRSSLTESLTGPVPVASERGHHVPRLGQESMSNGAVFSTLTHPFARCPAGDSWKRLQEPRSRCPHSIGPSTRRDGGRQRAVVPISFRDNLVAGSYRPSAATTRNTGSLTTWTGDFVTTAASQVVQNLDITGRVKIRHDGVTFRNCRIQGG